MKLLIIAVATDRHIKPERVNISGLGGTLAAVECIDPPGWNDDPQAILDAAQRTVEALENATAGHPADAQAPAPAAIPDDWSPHYDW